jgi:hypothetical protein
MRRTVSRVAGQGPLHVVSAWAIERGVVLGQVATDAKSNEITAIPELLDAMDVEGTTVTIDATGTQPSIRDEHLGSGSLTHGLHRLGQ